MTKHLFLFAFLLGALLLGTYVFEFRQQTRVVTGKVTAAPDGALLPGVTVQVKGSTASTTTDKQGKYKLQVPAKQNVLVFSYIGYKTKEVKIGTRTEVNVALETSSNELLEMVVISGVANQQALTGRAQGIVFSTPPPTAPGVKYTPPVVKRDGVNYEADTIDKNKFNTEEYDAVHDNPFLEVTKNALSTFSIDVDKASYSNVRRFLTMGQRPPKDAVRIEEMLNYFTYDYPQPEGKDPFSVTTELAPCPWNKQNQLLHIGLQGKNIPLENLPPSNLVLLLDVSGSMDMPEKLPLVKAGFKLLVDQLRPQDKVSIVVYAGAAGQVLAPTSGDKKAAIMQAIDNLQAGGSTAGGEGIKLAYQLAQQQFIKGGNNRVVLATDGDFNVGVSSNAELERLIEQKRESGVFLTVLGFGMGNYKDSKMVDQLRPQDKVSIVVYAGAAGQVLAPTSGDKKAAIMQAIDNLQAGGSTAGGEGIKLAYQLAQQQFIKGGNNRVVLATDGDFNVGVSSNAELERLIEQKRESGVFLTVLGFGMGNYKDSKMEKLADKGNGNYAYVDNMLEAKKVFVNEFGGTLFTIAKDVKLQVEFNPAQVKAYRLIGYENRALRNEDFNDDKKDAGDLGSGHTVTALYEIVPAGAGKSGQSLVDDLKYQSAPVTTPAANTNEVLTLKLRYKQPDGNKSSLVQTTVLNNPVAAGNTSDNFRFSAAVASFGMLLRDSEHKGTATYASVLALAESARGKDKEGYRIEFINMVKSMSLLSSDR